MGNLIYAASQWGILLVLARETDAKTLGQYALGIAISAPIIMFGNMRLRMLLAADAKNKFDFSDYRYVRFVTASLSILIIMFIAALGPYTRMTALVILVIGIAKAIQSVSDLYYGLFQKVGKLKIMGVSLTLKAILSLVTFSIVVMQTENLFLGVLALLFSWTSLFLLYDYPSAKRIFSKWHSLEDCGPIENKNIGDELKNNWRNHKAAKLVRSSAILGVVALLGSLLANVPRYFIDAVLGSEKLGFYAAMAYVGVAGLLVAASLIQPIMPGMAVAYKGGNFDSFYRLVKKVILIALGLGVMGYLIVWFQGELILRVLYGELYSQYADVFSLIMVAVGLNYIVLYQWYILTAMGELRQQLVLSAVTIVSLLAMCAFLIPKYGLMGAAIAEIVGMLVHVLLGMTVIVNIYRRSRVAWESSNLSGASIETIPKDSVE